METKLLRAIFLLLLFSRTSCQFLSPFPAPADPSVFNESLSFHLYQYSKISYCLNSSIVPWTCGAQCLVMQAEDIGLSQDFYYETQGMTLFDVENEMIVVAFRGSHNFMNWVLNFEVILDK